MSTEVKDFNADNLTGENQEGSNANWPVKFLTATSIIGDKVENNKGDNLGKIKDIMLDIRQGKVEYVVIEYGGFLGVGEKLFAVPFRSLELDTANHQFILNKSKETFEKAPGFEKDHWPETNSHEYYHDVDTYWGGFMGPNTGATF